MTPWTALLESFHSALIDELVERHPEPKPELGMPIRQRVFALPAEGLADLVACEAAFSEAKGCLFLALDSGCAGALNMTARGLWDSLLKRAGGELHRREVKPSLGMPLVLKGELPKGLEPARVVWIPFRLKTGTCYLGLAV